MNLFINDPWREEAACQGVDPNVFFPTGSSGRAGVTQEIEEAWVAAVWCTSCPVKAECLADALAHGDQGVRGGTTEVQRKRMRRSRWAA